MEERGGKKLTNHLIDDMINKQTTKLTFDDVTSLPPVLISPFSEMYVAWPQGMWGPFLQGRLEIEGL